MHAFLSRPLFSALLDALPQNTWCKREDVYECREADYIAEVEGSLLFAKGQMILHLFKFFLQSKTSLSEDKIAQVSFITSIPREGAYDSPVHAPLLDLLHNLCCVCQEYALVGVEVSLIIILHRKQSCLN